MKGSLAVNSNWAAVIILYSDEQSWPILGSEGWLLFWSFLITFVSVLWYFEVLSGHLNDVLFLLAIQVIILLKLIWLHVCRRTGLEKWPWASLSSFLITQRWHPLILCATSITNANTCFTLTTSDSNGTQGFVFLTLRCFSLVTQI